jgi:hypothetical protein
MRNEEEYPVSCPLPSGPDLSKLTVVELAAAERLGDYREAMRLANAEAGKRLGDNMLLSWYDRDRDFESPQHASECHLDSAVPGYVDYGVYHGATLKVDIEQGRFVFFYLPVEMPE